MRGVTEASTSSHRPQLLPREIAGHQRRTRRSVGPYPHGQHIKDLGRGELSPGTAEPAAPVRRQGDRGSPPAARQWSGPPRQKESAVSSPKPFPS